MSTSDRAQVIQDYQRHTGDVGSSEVQVALLTHKISYLTDHLKLNKHDNATRRSLIGAVGRRRRLMRYLRSTRPEAHAELSSKLGIKSIS